MTSEEIAAFALAVHVRTEVLHRLDRHDLDPGDHFPVEEWREAYVQALKLAQDWEATYPDPEFRVHKMRPYMPAIDPVGPRR